MPKVGLLQPRRVFVRVFGAAQAAENMIFEVLIFFIHKIRIVLNIFVVPFLKSKWNTVASAKWCSVALFIISSGHRKMGWRLSFSSFEVVLISVEPNARDLHVNSKEMLQQF